MKQPIHKGIEKKDPHKYLPIAMLILFIVMVLFFGLNIAVLIVM